MHGIFKTKLNLLVIGQANSGRSTTIGQIAHKCGLLNQKLLKDLPHGDSEVSEKIQNYDQLLHHLKGLREQGKDTNKLFSIEFETSAFKFTIDDAVGHRDFLKNVIVGSTKPQVALLIVSAIEDEFQESISEQGYIIQQLNLSLTLGLKQIIIAVNKMDHSSVHFSEQRFNEIQLELQNILSTIGYNPDDIPIIPTSGITCCNLFDKSADTPWYQGITLLEALNSLQKPKNLDDQPLRLSLREVYKIGGIGTVPQGIILSGTLQKGLLLKFPLNNNIVSECISLEMGHEVAYNGDNTAFNIKGVEVNQLTNQQDIVCDAERDPAKRAVSIQALITNLKNSNEFSIGNNYTIHCHYASVPCRLESIHQKYDKRTGKVLAENSLKLKINESLLITLIPLQPIIVEAFSEYPKLGRFILKDEEGIVVVAGIIKHVNKLQN